MFFSFFLLLSILFEKTHTKKKKKQVISHLAEELHDVRVRKDCVLTLCNLSYGTNSAQMTLDGATHTLCELCDLRSAITMERISIVFRNLSSHQGNVRRMVGAGVVPTLVAIASKGSLDTKIHCMVGLCLISFEPTVRLAMAEEGAIPAIMELSSYIGTRAAVHYCGMAISNIAAESKAQGILVKAGAITTLMAWMDQASTSEAEGSSRKNKHHQEQTEEELMHAARQRAEVPAVEEGELEALTERFDEPKINFEEKSLPWRKFHIQLRVSEPEPPPLPTIQRPVIVNRKDLKRQRAAAKAALMNAANEGDESAAAALIGGRPPNPADVENEKILKRAGDKMSLMFEGDYKVGDPDAELVEKLKRKDGGSWAKRTEVLVSGLKKTSEGEDGDDQHRGSPGGGNNEGGGEGTDGAKGGFEELFQSMRTGDMPMTGASEKDEGNEVPETSSPVGATSPLSFRSPASGTGSPMLSPTSSMGDPRFSGAVNNEVFDEFELTMDEVRDTTDNATFGSLGFGEEDFFKHLDNLNLVEPGRKIRK